MSRTSKVCPQCQQNNAALNLACIRCQTSLVHEPFAASWTENYPDAGPHPFWAELFNPTLMVCAPLSVLFTLLAIFSLGSPLTPIFFLAAIVLGGTPFFPADPVGDYFRSRLDQLARKQAKEKEL